MRKFVYESWNGVMEHNKNPLKNIPDLNTRHMIMQILAWMWCGIFNVLWKYVDFWNNGNSTSTIISAIVVTVATFHTAKNLN